jgi:ketosteroid isomerase-like protein
MPHGFQDPLQIALWDRVRELNESWTRGDLARLDAYFHPDCVIVAPGFAQRWTGRKACADSYRDFVTQAKVLDHWQGDADVRIYGETAVVTYRFRIDFEMSGQRQREEGWDLLVFVRDKKDWLVAWRTLIPSPS